MFSAHGGNFLFLSDYAARRPVEALSDLPRWFEVAARAAASTGLTVSSTDQHAGVIETSQALDLFPSLVADTTGVCGLIEAAPGWEDRLWQEGIGALSPNGVLGDPREATAKAGAAINAALSDMLARWLVNRFGRDGAAPGV